MDKVGQKLQLFLKRVPVVTCYIENGSLTDHSEKLQLPLQLF